MKPDTVVLPALSLVCWALFLSLGWLIPNHYLPWTTFHSDAWVAVSLWLGMAAILFRSSILVQWNMLSITSLIAIFVPWVQWAAGQIDFLGQAWISSAYLLGFLLAMHLGQRWEELAPGQIIHAMFGAFVLASLASFGLQLYTWLGLHGTAVTDLVSMGLVGNRLYANLGQPNLLASLLLWGLLGTLLFYQDQMMRAWVAIILAICLVIGLAFTQSRTGALSLTVLVVFILWWRVRWRSPYVALVAASFYIVYWVLPGWLSGLHQFIFTNDMAAYSRPIQTTDLRLEAWKLFIAAILEHPWFGYGWSDIAKAQVEVSTQFPPLGVIFGQTHNLFLDILLWIGVPLGIALIGVLLSWLVNALLKTTDPRGLICLLALMVMGVHAMLEFPLHHAFFLLPTGILIGIVNRHSDYKGIVQTKPWTLLVLWAMAGVALIVTVLDYVRSEESYYALRFEKARIGVHKTQSGIPPDVIVLTQLRDWVWAERVVLSRNMSRSDLKTLYSIAQRFPTGPTIFRVAKASAITSEPARAQYWIDRLCFFVSERECIFWRKTWEEDQLNYPEMAQVVWRQEPNETFIGK